MRNTTKTQGWIDAQQKTRETQAKQKQARIIEYNKNPSTCEMCGIALDYVDRKSRFCGHSCACKFTNPLRITKTQESNINPNRICIKCGNKTSSSNNKFCCIECSSSYRSNRSVEKWLSGVLVGYSGKAMQTKAFVRKWLFDTRGTKCEECGWDDRHPIYNTILTEIHHRDGDASHCTPDNLIILCPCCHAKTPNHRAKNKTSKRNRK